jgi:general secretion pathway protein A
MSPRHQEGLAHLFYGIKKGGGFVTLTGEVGTGKTTLCYCFLEQLPDAIEIALILNPKLNSIELLASICDELGIQYPANNQSLKTFIDLLNKYLLAAHAKRKHTILIIDEAQNLSFEVLEQIRLLTNLETSTKKLLQIILIGQPELKQLLNRVELRQLNQRITARYHLEPLSLTETRAYIQHRLSVSGGRQDIFNDSAIRKIFKLTKGIPRSINILCDRALLGAYASDVHKINAKIIKKAALEALPEKEKKQHPVKLAIGMTMLTFIMLGAGLHFFIKPLPNFITQILYPTVNGPSLSEFTPPAEKKPNLTLNKPAKHTPPPGKEPMVGPIKADTIFTSAVILDDALDQPATNKTEDEVTKSFKEIITNSGLDLTTALIELLNIWSVRTPSGEPVTCDLILQSDINCLFDIDTWKQIIALNRPTILEFSLPGGIKRYAVLIGIERGQPLLRINDDYIFPLNDILSYWQGYFLTLWKPPFPQMQPIHPQQTSNKVLWLRQQLDAIEQKSIAARKPRYYDQDLKKRVIRFQHRQHLHEDGIIGPRTTIHLQNSTAMNNSPLLDITD